MRYLNPPRLSPVVGTAAALLVSLSSPSALAQTDPPIVSLNVRAELLWQYTRLDDTTYTETADSGPMSYNNVEGSFNGASFSSTFTRAFGQDIHTGFLSVTLDDSPATGNPTKIVSFSLVVNISEGSNPPYWVRTWEGQNIDLTSNNSGDLVFALNGAAAEGHLPVLQSVQTGYSTLKEKRLILHTFRDGAYPVHALSVSIWNSDAPPADSYTVEMLKLRSEAVDILDSESLSDRAYSFEPKPDPAILTSQPAVANGVVADGVTPLLFKITGTGLTNYMEVVVDCSATNGRVADGLQQRLRLLRNGAWISYEEADGTVELTPPALEAYVFLPATEAWELHPDEAETGIYRAAVGANFTATPEGRDPVVKPFRIHRAPLAIATYEDPRFPRFSTNWSNDTLAAFEHDREAEFLFLFDITADEPGFTDWYYTHRADWAGTRFDCVADLLTVTYVLDSCKREGPQIWDRGGRTLLPYRNEFNKYLGWYQRVVTVNGNHRGSRLQPYISAFVRACDTLARSQNKPALSHLPIVAGHFNPFVQPVATGAPQYETLFNPVSELYAKKLRDVFYDRTAQFHHIATTIDPILAIPYQFLGLTGDRLTLVANDGSDGVLDIDSARVGRDRPHSIVAGNIAAIPGVWGTNANIYNSPDVASQILRAFAAPDTAVQFPFDSFRPGSTSYLTREFAFRPITLYNIIRHEGERAVFGFAEMERFAASPAPLGTETRARFAITANPQAPPAGDVNWIVETYTAEGATTEGASWQPVAGEALEVEVVVDASTVGDTVVFASYPTAAGGIVLAEPQLVRREEPAGTTMTGISLSATTWEMPLDDSYAVGLFAEYNDGSRLRRWVTVDEVTVGCTNLSVVDASNPSQCLGVGVGTATVTVQYMGFSAQTDITVFDPYPPQSFDQWRAEIFDAEELADPAVSGADVDLDGDGLALVFEYLSGGRTRAHDDPMLRAESVEIDGEMRMALAMRVSRSLAGQVLVQRSGDLSSWDDWFIYDPSTVDLEASPVVGASDTGPWRLLFLADESMSSATRNYFRVAYPEGTGPGGEITGTSELIFDLGGGALQSYGDRVPALTMGSFSYGGEPDFTPNVEVSYHNIPRTWSGGYGDLQNILYSDLGSLGVRLFADIGYRAVLESFDMAAYDSSFGADPTIQSVKVFDGNLSPLFSMEDATISEKARTTFEMPDGVEADILWLQVDATNLSSSLYDDIAVDNLRFSQRPLIDLGNSTLLTFDINGLPNGSDLPAGYGDRVSSSNSGGFSYVGSGSYTPGITLDVGPTGGNPSVWGTGFGGLQQTLYNENEHVDTLEIILAADLGSQVRLYGFDLAAVSTEFSSDPVIDSVTVLDGAAAVLFSASNVTISEHYQTRIDLSASPPQAQNIIIRIDATNLGIYSEDIGIDNIRFRQVP